MLLIVIILGYFFLIHFHGYFLLSEARVQKTLYELNPFSSSPQKVQTKGFTVN